MRIRNYIAVLTVLFLPVLSVAAQSPTADKLPDSPIGQRVAAYFKAYNSGDDSAMRDYILSNMAPETLERRPIDDRLRVYRQGRGGMGSVEVEGVAEGKKSAGTVPPKNEKSRQVRLIFVF